MQIQCHHCRTIMAVPDQAGQLGGTFSCPGCRAINTVAPVAQVITPSRMPLPSLLARPAAPQAQAPASAAAPMLPVAQRPRPSSARSELAWQFWRGLFIAIVAVVGCLILARAVPILAVFLGLAVIGVAFAYLASDTQRMRVDRIFGRRGAKRWVGTTLAALAGCWAFLSLFGFGLFVATGGIERAQAEKTAEEAATRADVERQRLAEAAAQKLAADEKLKLAESAAASGQFEEARRIADQVHSDMPTHPGTEGVLQKVTDGVQQQIIAGLPAKLADIETRAIAGQWNEAGAICDEVQPVAASNAGIVSACARVDVQRRKAAVAGWIFEAREVVAEKCDTPKPIADAWANLRKVHEGDEGYSVAKKVAVALEKCRKKAEKEYDGAVRGVMVVQRQNRADQFETLMLDSGMDVSVTLRGKYKDQMTVRWILLGRVTVHQLTKDGELMAGLQNIGFKRVTFTDGYYESYVYDLEPQSEEGGGKLALAGLGLDTPIKM